MNLTLNIYTKAGRTITVGANQELADRIIDAFANNRATSITIGGANIDNKFTIPLDNIDYIEVS